MYDLPTLSIYICACVFYSEQARQEYTEMVEMTNNFQNDLCFNQLPQALMSMRETAEQMVSVVQTALKAFEMQQVSLVGSVDIQLVSLYCKLGND